MKQGWVRSLVFVGVASVAGHAQQGLRGVSGVVVDQHREPLKDAVVYCENDDTQTVTTFVTLRDGRFEFKRLNAEGDYHLWAGYRGTLTKKRFLSKFDSAKQKTYTITVRLH